MTKTGILSPNIGWCPTRQIDYQYHDNIFLVQVHYSDWMKNLSIIFSISCLHQLPYDSLDHDNSMPSWAWSSVEHRLRIKIRVGFNDKIASETSC